MFGIPREISLLTPRLDAAGNLTAHFFVHPPVNRLHSIAAQAHTVRGFLLTLKMKGVKTTSFFDTF
jgi:hypothetical protein